MAPVEGPSRTGAARCCFTAVVTLAVLLLLAHGPKHEASAAEFTRKAHARERWQFGMDHLAKDTGILHRSVTPPWPPLPSPLPPPRLPPPCAPTTVVRDEDVALAVCVAGHLRTESVSAAALGAVKRLVRLHGRAAAVVATWDVFGVHSTESKSRSCYDLWPLGPWRCPSFVRRCEVLPFVDRQAELAAAYGSAGARIASMYTLVGRAFSLALGHFPNASRFLRTRPDLYLFRRLDADLIGGRLASHVMTYAHPFWRGALNDMLFVTDRLGASSISQKATAWAGAHVGTAATAEGLFARFLAAAGVSVSVRKDRSPPISKWRMLRGNWGPQLREMDPEAVVFGLPGRPVRPASDAAHSRHTKCSAIANVTTSDNGSVVSSGAASVHASVPDAVRELDGDGHGRGHVRDAAALPGAGARLPRCPADRAPAAVEQARALLASTPRPAWLRPPPTAALLRRRPLSPAPAPAVTLASVGFGQAPYVRARERFRRHAADGAFNSTVVWGESGVREDPLAADPAFAAQFEALGRNRQRRPFCAAFKPLAIWRALERGCDGDYVLWADSSPRHPRQALNWTAGGGPAVRGAIAALRGASAFGQVHCASRCELGHEEFFDSTRRMPGLGALVSERTSDGFVDLMRPNASVALRRPHLLAANMLLRNEPINRLLVWDWLMMALARPSAFCGSHTQDQAAFTILAHNRTLPLVSFCAHRSEEEGCFVALKNVNTFVQHINEGRFSVWRGADQHQGSAVGRRL